MTSGRMGRSVTNAMSNLIAGFPNTQLARMALRGRWSHCRSGRKRLLQLWKVSRCTKKLITSGVILNNRDVQKLRVNSGAGEYCGIAPRAGCGLFAEAVFDVARFHCVLALEPHIGDCMREGTKPHAIHLGETHQYVEIMYPPRGILGRTALYAADVVVLRVHPDIAAQQVFFFALGAHTKEKAAPAIQHFVGQQLEIIILKRKRLALRVPGRLSLLAQDVTQ